MIIDRNIRLQVSSSFTWANPLSASSSSPAATHASGEGHAHLYLDGVKIARIYCGGFHLDASRFPSLTDQSSHTLKASVYGNDHVPYLFATGGEAAAVEATLSSDRESLLCLASSEDAKSRCDISSYGNPAQPPSTMSMATGLPPVLESLKLLSMTLGLWECFEAAF